MAEEHGHSAKNDMIARDIFAADRTVLAIDRTFLAYLRTALTFLIAGISLIKLFPDSVWEVVGWCCLPLTVFTFVAGIHTRIKYGKLLKKILSAGG